MPQSSLKPSLPSPARLPATTDHDLFLEAVAVGQRLLKVWTLQCGPRGVWAQQAPTGTPLGAATLLGATATFDNGDTLAELHLDTLSLTVSGYPIMQRWLEGRAHLPLTTALASEARVVAGAIGEILECRAASDWLIQRALGISDKIVATVGGNIGDAAIT